MPYSIFHIASLRQERHMVYMVHKPFHGTVCDMMPICHGYMKRRHYTANTFCGLTTNFIKVKKNHRVDLRSNQYTTMTFFMAPWRFRPFPCSRCVNMYLEAITSSPQTLPHHFDVAMAAD